jgi:hypothetical protein
MRDYINSECPVAKAKAEGVECWRERIKQLAALPDLPMPTNRRILTAIAKEEQR